jgi:hypothetical protein
MNASDPKTKPNLPYSGQCWRTWNKGRNRRVHKVVEKQTKYNNKILTSTLTGSECPGPGHLDELAISS